MIVCIKKNQFAKFTEDIFVNDKIYIDNNFKIVKLDEKYSDCQYSDFNEDFSFNPVKYQTRKTIEITKQKIEEYKQKLCETDYKAIKYAEGLISETDYAPIKAERENYRKAINSLEISLK